MIKYTTIKINYKKEKNEETGPSQTYKHLHIKENHKQNKKTTYRMGENIWKQCNWQGTNFQNIQMAHRTQFKKKNPITY